MEKKTTQYFTVLISVFNNDHITSLNISLEGVAQIHENLSTLILSSFNSNFNRSVYVHVHFTNRKAKIKSRKKIKN